MAGLINWISMNGYAIYIWPAYGFAISTVGLNIIMLQRQRLQTKKKLQAWFKQQA